MKIWDKILNLDIKDKERYQKLFSEAVKDVQDNKLKLNIGETEYEDYYIIIEENRMDSYFVHIVPKQAYPLFKEAQKQAPDSFLGFSVVASKYNNKSIRVSCFGIDCSSLGKALIKN